MPDEQPPANIFDAASQKLGKKAKSLKEGAPAAGSKPSTTKRIAEQVVDPEVQRMLDRMKWMKQDLDDKMEALKKKSGLNDEQFEKYIQHLAGLDIVKLEESKKKRAELEEKILNVVGPSNQQRALQIQSTEPPKSKPLTEKERKSKTIGARRNWLPMR